MTVIRLPWPPRELSPNARVHWRTYRAEARVYRQAAWALAMEAGAQGIRADALSLAITFQPPNRARRDLDNCLAAIKAGLDGIADACGVDDSRWSLALTRGEPVKGGAVVISVSEVIPDLHQVGTSPAGGKLSA